MNITHPKRHPCLAMFHNHNYSFPRLITVLSDRLLLQILSSSLVPDQKGQPHLQKERKINLALNAHGAEDDQRRPDPDPGNALYDDGNVQLTKHSLVLRGYYFPFNTSRTIPLKDIKRVTMCYPRAFLQMKSWGMGIDLQTWWHLDFGRIGGPRNALVIHTGAYPSAGITPGHGVLDTCVAVERHLRQLCPQATFS
jgi:hypothetical protein